MEFVVSIFCDVGILISIMICFLILIKRLSLPNRNKSNSISGLKKVKLNPGDTLIVTLSKNSSMSDDYAEIKQIFQESFPNNDILFMTKEVELEVIQKGE